MPLPLAAGPLTCIPAGHVRRSEWLEAYACRWRISRAVPLAVFRECAEYAHGRARHQCITCRLRHNARHGNMRGHRRSRGYGRGALRVHGVSPRELHARHLAVLQQTLLRQDASITGVRSHDELDLARRAQVTASSTLTGIALEQPGETYPLGTDVALLLPVHPVLSGLELLLDASSDTALTVELWDTGRKENYVPHLLQVTATVNVTAGTAQWVKLPLEWRPEEPQNAFIIIRSNKAVSLYHSTEAHSGVLIFFKTEENHVSKNLEDHATDQPVVLWSMQGLARQPFCCRTLSETSAYSSDNTINGYHRPSVGRNSGCRSRCSLAILNGCN